MNRRRKGWTLTGAVLALSLSSGCAPVTLTAASSINPVMFGPAKTLGGENPPKESPRLPVDPGFRHRETIHLWLFCGGYACAGVVTSSTNPAVEEERGPDWSLNQAGSSDNPARLDWKVLRATGENPARRVELTSIRCEGVSSFLLFGIMISSGCEAEGIVPPFR